MKPPAVGGVTPRPSVRDALSAVNAPAIVGRRHELEIIDGLLEMTARGAAGSIALIGEPGIGKTALLTEASRMGRAMGLSVLDGRATEFERQIPFGLAVNAFDEPLGHLDPAWLARAGEDRLAELASVFPSLRRGGQGTSGATLAPRSQWQHAVRLALDALAREQPVLVCLDDVHWADDASLELVVHLLARPANAVALVVAYRDRAAPPILPQAISTAERSGDATVWELGPLSEDEARELVGDWLGAAELDALYRETDGNPFYLRELVRLRAGTQRPPRKTWQRLQAEDVPAAVEAQIAAEVERGSTNARSLLTAAAVLSQPFPLELAMRIAGLDEDDGLEALDELLGLDLVRPADTPRRFFFRHPIVRHAVYSSAGAGSVLAAHAGAARVLEASGAPLPERAGHVERSAHPGDEQAAELLESAAHAIASRAPATAARWLSRALQLLPADASAGCRLRLLLPLAATLRSIGQCGESRARLAQALKLLSPKQVVLRGTLACAIARLDHAAGEHANTSLLLEALDAGASTRSAETAALKLELAVDHCFAANPGEMARLAAGAQEDAYAIGDRLLCGTASGLLALAHQFLGENEAARECANRTASLLDRLSDAELATRPEALTALAGAELGLERFADGARHAERAISLCGATGQESWRVLATCVVSRVRLVQGRIGDAGDAAERAIAESEVERGPLRLWALSLHSWVATLKGELGTAVRAGEEAVTLAGRLPTTLQGWLASHCLALALIETAQPVLARQRLLEGCLGPDLVAVDPNRRPGVYEVLCRVELASGDLDAARVWAERAEAAAVGAGLPGGLAEAHGAHGAVALAGGDDQEAADLALRAEAGFTKSGRRLDAARAAIAAGKALAAIGEGEEAIGRLRRAHSALAACGAVRHRDEAARELRRLGRRVGGRAAPSTSASNGTGIESLSARERDVAVGVARGMRNREIAAHLFLSPKTIERHLSRIFAKLGITSRAELAATTERAGLATSERA